ncbi:LTO1 maturation factor of ABCE1 [Phyllostomus discolor]|uniref:LTO1 maturation factor of ABCE1 n=1 Tax=Phyllostomus discolor TaxID=89673 RepID=A0A833ZX19_9CHIR|nr:LTO1 maturation factor of ABCE1 [Phyllostomus discolor]
MAGSEDPFDAIVMADDRFRGEGYQEGYEEGSSLGIIEGKRHGTLYGAKVGSEVGCYQGFALAWRCLLHSHAAVEKDRFTEKLGRKLRESPSTVCPVISITHWQGARVRTERADADGSLDPSPQLTGGSLSASDTLWVWTKV